MDLTFATEGELATTLMREALTDGVGFDPAGRPATRPRLIAAAGLRWPVEKRS
ncbi:hypothetical protein LDL08_00010 [Nonomuraea glycinis]|uniref:hypothetical protein n=1 Tax=Nonomuraea glycinis TaxID=2047744 RepID=UPI0016674A5E|nr:hypothetical protein [Nonomuraea glycinis]MCA2174559.1 hypothetical protein [Nonomuraea glycinis]